MDLRNPPTRRVKGIGFPCNCPFSCLPMFFYPVLYPGVLGEGAGGGGPPVYLAPGGRGGSHPPWQCSWGSLPEAPEAPRGLPEAPGRSRSVLRSCPKPPEAPQKLPETPPGKANVLQIQQILCPTHMSPSSAQWLLGSILASTWDSFWHLIHDFGNLQTQLERTIVKMSFTMGYSSPSGRSPAGNRPPCRPSGPQMVLKWCQNRTKMAPK